MKTLIFKGWAFAAAAAAIISCKTEDKPSIDEGPKFPEKQQIEISAGEQKEISFVAEADWKLVIDKTTWCAFLDNGVETAQISGKAGNVTATVTVKDNGLDFTSDVASIDLTLGTKTETIYEITRPGKAREIKLYVASSDYGSPFAEAEKIEVTYGEWGVESPKFTIVANYDWTVAAPEGFSFESKSYEEIPGLSGTAGIGPDSEDFNYAAVKVNDEILPYEKDTKITVTDTEGNNPVEFTLHYSGMGENTVVFDPQNITGTGQFNIGLPFSADGFKIEQSDPFSSGTVTTEKTASFNVQAKNMKYAIHKIGIVDGSAVELGEDSWVSVTDDKAGKISVSVTSNDSEERKAYILVLSEAADKNFKIEDYCSAGEIGYDYQQLTVTVKQKGVKKANDFKVMWGAAYTEVKTIEFSAYPEFAGMEISDLAWGSAADNAYVIEISDSDVLTTYDEGQTYYSAGALMIAPVGFPDDYYPVGASEDANLFRFVGQSGNWNTSYITSASIYTAQGNLNGIQIDPAQFIDTESKTSKNFQGMAVVQFYMNADDKAAYKSSATLVIVKK